MAESDRDAEYEDNPVGERYDLNYKNMMPHETLSVETKKVISNIPMLDENGERLRDDLGYDILYDPVQVQGVILRIGARSTVETFMNNLKNAEDDYPWMKALIEKLEADGHARTTFMVDFIKDTTYFMGVYQKHTRGDGDVYAPSLANTRASRGALVREVSHTINEGLVLDKQMSIYNEQGVIGRPAGIHSDNNLAKNVELDKAYFYEAYKKLYELHKNYSAFLSRRIRGDDGKYLSPSKKSELWKNEHKDDVIYIKSALRGVGFNLTLENVNDAFGSEYYSGHRKRRRNVRWQRRIDPMKETLKGLMNIYHAASIHVGASADDFYSKVFHEKYINVQRNYEDIGKAMSSSVLDDVESRARVGDNTYSSFTTPNLLNQIFKQFQTKYDEIENGVDDLVEAFLNKNNGSLSRFLHGIHPEDRNKETLKRYEQWVMDEFGCEGNLDLNGKLTGWMKYPGGQKFNIVDFATFINNEEYEKLSPLQKFIVTYTFQMEGSSLGEFLYECPIESDYTTNNYITHSILQTGSEPLYKVDSSGNKMKYKLDDPAVIAVTDEVLCEIARMEKARARSQANEEAKSKGEALPYPDFGVYSTEAQRFQIFPSFNVEGKDDVYAVFHNLKERSETDAINYLKTKVCDALMDVIKKDYIKAYKLGFFNEEQFKDYVADWDAREEELKKTKNESARIDLTAEWGMTDVMLDKNLPEMTGKGFDEFMRFSINSFYGRQQISKIMGINPAWFVSYNEMLKRQMMLHAPGSPIDYTAEWDGKRVGRENDVCVYIDDSKEASAYIEQYKQMLERLIDHGITKKQAEQFISDYEHITETDGQSFRTLESFRVFRIGMGDGAWNQEFEEAYNRLMNQRYRYESDEQLNKDLSLFMGQNIKPVVTGYEIVTLDDGSKVKVPVLHKHSEAVLLPSWFYDKYKILQANTPYLKSLALAAEEEFIDSFVFASGAKVGFHSQVSSLTEKEKDAEGKLVLDENGKPKYVHKNTQQLHDHIVNSIRSSKYTKHLIPFKYYRIAASTPTHLLDQTRAWAQQSIKTMMIDLAPNEKCDANGHVMKAQEAKKQFQKLQTAQLVRAYQELDKLFNEPDKMEEVLQDELATKDYNSPELREMLTLLKDGKFTIAPFNPTISRLAQQLLMSIMRKRLVRTGSKGGSAIAQSAVGLDFANIKFDDDISDDEKLHVVFDGEGDNLRIKYVECYLPIYDSRLLQFADKHGNISAERLKQLVEEGQIPESMLNFIGLRTPADGPHSTIPLHVKGFKSNISGGSIIAPRDLMVWLGQNFDGDKILMHFKDFTVYKRFDRVALQRSYRIYKENAEKYYAKKEIDNVMTEEEYLNSIYSFYNDTTFREIAAVMYTLERRPDLFHTDREEFENEVYKTVLDYEDIKDSDLQKYINRAAKNKNIVPYCKEYKYDWSKEPSEQGKKAIDNALIDIMFGFQTSPEGSRRLIMPGGFEETKSIAMAIMLTKAMKARGEEVTTKKFGTFLTMNPKSLSNMLKNYQGTDSPYSASSAINAYENIVKGKQLVSRFALYNAAFAQLQGSKIRIYAHKKGDFVHKHLSLFKHDVEELFKVFDRTKKSFSSRILSQVINAAVDNGKCPILGDINLNEDTVDFFAAMDACGFTQDDIIIFMNHPLFKMITQEKNSIMSSKFRTGC